MEFTSISDIVENAEGLTRDDVIALVPAIAEYYQDRIDRLGIRAYGNNIAPVSRDAFRELAKVTIFNGMSTYMFTKQHWRTKRDLNSYLLVCLRRLADNLFYEAAAAKKQSSLICPGCRELPGNPKIILVPEGKVWRCPSCSNELDRLTEDQKKGRVASADRADVQARIGIHKSFVVQSRKGYRCPEIECHRFIPDSLNGHYGIACPYPDCSFFGSVENLESMSHPVTLTVRQTVSLNQAVTSSGSTAVNAGAQLQDFFAADDIPPDEKISMNQSFAKEFKTLMGVIDAQMEKVRAMNNNGTRTQKLLMYEAFKTMCVRHPDEMVSYLVHLKQSAEVPLQPRIFQTYIGLMENALPFVIERRGEEIDILSINDPELNLFLGKSEFTATVNEKGVIPNSTIETYTGGRLFKNHGACFLGRLIDVRLKSGESMIEKVRGYTFVEIETSLPEGTEVTVSHLRTYPHYEMGHMVFLQRIRLQIVDRVYFLLHKQRRKDVGKTAIKAA